MSVMVGQKVGIGAMSIETAMELDPMIRDAESEMSRITADGLRKALLNGLEQQSASGQLDPNTVARIIKKIGDGKTPIEEAVNQVHEEMQKEQAAQQQQPSPDTQTPGAGPDMQAMGQDAGQPMPEQQPGMAAPGSAGAPDLQGQGQPSIEAPSPSMDNLSQLLGNLHKTSQVPA
jgi:hypothetical protein